jgi:hypothetical protein
MADDRGWFQKYRVERLVPSIRGIEHDERCRYFVIDTTHDPYAAAALTAYADACEDESPNLAVAPSLSTKVRNQPRTGAAGTPEPDGLPDPAEGPVLR